MIYSSYYSVIAPISLCLFAALTSLAAVRLYASYISAPKEDKQAAGEEKKIDEKIIVQTALFCMGVVEIVNSISFWVERGYNVWGFALHMTGQFGVVVALTSFMMMWARFLSFGDDNNMLRVIYWTVLGLNALVTVISISVAFACSDFSDLGEHYAIVLLLNFMVIAMTMLLISGWMFLYGLRIYIRLRSTSLSSDRSAAIAALRRVNIVLSVLVICATLRVFSLVILMIDIIRHSHDQEDLGILLWFIFSNWIPTLVPGFTLLHITRRGGVSSNSSSQQSLIQGTDTSHIKSSMATPLTSEYTSSTAGGVMVTESIYSSGKTLRTASSDMEFATRMSSGSYIIPGHKLSMYERDTEESITDRCGSAEVYSAYKHHV